MWITSRTKPKNGSVLIAVLVVLALCAAVLWLVQAGAMARSANTDLEAERIENITFGVDCLRSAMRLLAEDEDLLVDHLNEDWAFPFELRHPDGRTALVRIEDANRYFDLNNAPVPAASTPTRPVAEILHELFRTCGLHSNTTDQVGALIDAVDANNAGRFEDPEEFNPANAPLSTWTDLFRVVGVEADVFRAAQPDPDRVRGFGEFEHPLQTFTILPDPDASPRADPAEGEVDDPAATPEPDPFGNDEQPQEDRRRASHVNLNTAPAHVLRGVIGNTPDRAALVEQLLAYRVGNPITAIGPYLGRLPPADVQIATAYLDTKSSHFWVTAIDAANGHQIARALVGRGSDGTVTVEQWLPAQAGR